MKALDAVAPLRTPPPRLATRILTDLHVPQIDWWSTSLTVLPAQPRTRNGTVATVVNAWRAVAGGLRCDAFISANVRNALALGFFKRITGRTRPALVMTEMRLDEPMPGLRWRIKLAMQRFAYSAVDVMCVSARREAESYAKRLRLPADRFRMIPWHTNVLEPCQCPTRGRYLFAAGRTSRDWPTLADAVRTLDIDVTVVCSAADAARVQFPPNVMVLTDIPYEEYRRQLEGSLAVLVPLEPHVYSSGQVVVLEAMALGKPVITTRVLGTEDYVVDNVDGLLVSPSSAASLRCAVERLLSDPTLAERMGRAALAKVLEQHTLDQYVRRITAVAETAACRR